MGKTARKVKRRSKGLKKRTKKISRKYSRKLKNKKKGGAFMGGVPPSRNKPPTGLKKKKLGDSCDPNLKYNPCQSDLKCNHKNKCQGWPEDWTTVLEELQANNPDIEAYTLIQSLFSVGGDKSQVESAIRARRAGRPAVRVAPTLPPDIGEEVD